ncbi:30S ribosomal protein S9 [Borrelia miyamotoi]|uniref:Small ribosomal subunit protein uS9 n=1 Tax=Borrelia miyamotoi TaxID=47466 RepID=A0AAX3JMQ0_9SPIR|nr:30S ribosomal protein S9 [Borrelia miyamotoi]QFP41989.1 30S ribosomal protein S9 [Borrelia miyamotoi]QFP48105.1 30S ribosomal protein S9 [Borrelia miyamotoi]QGT55864.1 30S ribosomal protein S9 [Borrelia miyamotoi]QGT56644.1 30S ribosomal protein S9 [Borrelia miyamotoi]WAZ71905.1 30S ribosomal protein S9 [Borrelia miyamotoi]
MASSNVKDINLGMGTGRRKSSVARVYIREGKGDIKINSKDVDSYMQLEKLKAIALSPLILTNTLGKYDFYINIYGGGISGQAGAIRHGIARALFALDKEHKMVLRANGFLTRDPRKVERKKFGKKKARKSFQFSKR